MLTIFSPAPYMLGEYVPKLLNPEQLILLAREILPSLTDLAPVELVVQKDPERVLIIATPILFEKILALLGTD